MFRRRPHLVVLTAALAIAASACGSSSTANNQGGAPPPSTAQTFKVQVDGKSDAANFGFLAFFPKDLTVHPGDTVEFTSVFTGEPHTVALGTLVDAGVAAALAAGPDAQDEPAELKKIPSLLPQGPGNAVQAAAQPCFLPTGDPPATDACPKAQQTQPAFDGTGSFFNSGFLADGDKFTVKLADTIKPGTYTFFCTLHRAGMTGTIKVVDAATPVPSPSDVTAAGKALIAEKAGKLAPVVSALRAGTLPPFVPTAAPDQVIAGAASQDVQDALVDEFGPKEVSIPVGGSLTWDVLGPHSIAFNVPEDAKVLLNKAPDGSVNLNEKTVMPVGGPGAPPPPDGPPPDGPPGPPTLVDAGSWDGTGFHSSGLLLSFPPALLAYKMTFTKAGTYAYACTIHPEMKGTVKVG